MFSILFQGEDKIALNGGRAYPKGSKPGFITYQYLNDDGTPIDTSNGTWTEEVRIEQLYVDTQPTPIATGIPTLAPGDGSDPAHSILTYGFSADDFSYVGQFKMIFWIGNGTERHGSATFYYEVVDNPGADPTV